MAIYAWDNWVFGSSLTIWYEILFVGNSINKNIQSKDTGIDIFIEECPISYFKKYREDGFENTIISVKEIASEMDVKLKFR